MNKGKIRRMQDIYRKIDEIIIHCTDTPKGMDVGVAEIDDWHRQKGWQGCGYHFVVRLDGSVEVGRDLNRAGAHCKDHNPFSIGIAYVGGRNADGETDDTRTPAQKVALKALLVALHEVWPRAELHGHNEFSLKACPCFNVKAVYGKLFDQQDEDDEFD